jgi:hypothetical protein
MTNERYRHEMHSDGLTVVQRTSSVKLSLCLTNYGLRHEGVWGRGYTDPYILDVEH